MTEVPENPFSLPLRDYDINPFLHPTSAMAGRRGRLLAEDGVEYVDLMCAWGTNLLGYGNRRVARAVARQARRHAGLGMPHPELQELSELLAGFIPSAEWVRYGKNGSDVCAGAVRLARAITGREKIAYRGYHGFYDWYMASTDAEGIPGVLRSTLVPLAELTPECVDATLGAHPGQVAAVIVNPLVGPFPTAEEVRGAIEAAHRHGALMIFDEMLSGFRIAAGGMQEVWGVKPDLSCFGKAIANGLPLSALVGKVEHMKELPRTYYGMTFEGEAVSIAAGLATVREVLALDVPSRLGEKGRRLRESYARLAEEAGLSTRLMGFDACLHADFDDHGPVLGRQAKWLWIQEMVKGKVFTLGSLILCLAHGEADLRRVEWAAETAFDTVRRAVDRGTVEGLLHPRVCEEMGNIHGPGRWRHLDGRHQADAGASPLAAELPAPERSTAGELPGSSAGAESATVPSRHEIEGIPVLGAGGGAGGYGTWWDGVAGSGEQALTTTYALSDPEDYADRGRHGDANTRGALQLVELAELGAGSRVLEIGCGAARVGRELLPHVGSWHGADSSRRLLVHAARRLSELGSAERQRATLCWIDGHGLEPLPDDGFDFAYATTTFAYLDEEDLFGYLLESARVLVPGGLLYFDTWNLEHPDAFRIWRQGRRLPPGASSRSLGRLRGSTEAALRCFLAEAGFRIERLERDRLLRVLARSGPPAALADDGAPPFGDVGTPANLERVAGTLVVQGWALDAVERVEVRLDGGPSRPARLGIPRPDVAGLFPRYPGAETCGFVLELSTAELEAGRHELEVTAVDSAGERRVLTGFHRAFRAGEV
ncbi:MAG: aminotransferase class III-fold pyridoxal phosphate-dependent enzyme [Holophagales bacterium]|nr:aminotransferase class III-fold pyridoxal phosphate-dependent enzyme [Holophagales bacterium]